MQPKSGVAFLSLMPRSSHRYERYASPAHDEQHELSKSPIDELMADGAAGQAIEITEMANGETIWCVCASRGFFLDLPSWIIKLT